MDDPLSAFLALMKPRRQGVGAVNFGGPWAVQFPRHRGLHCYAVSGGECWISVAEQPPRRLARNDCFILASGRPFRLAGDLDAQPMPAAEIAPFGQDGVSKVNGGGRCLLIGGHFLLDQLHEQLLSTSLQPLEVVRDEAHREALAWALKRMWIEIDEPQPGGRLVIEQLTQTLLIFALRLLLSSGAKRPPGWLAALGDRQITTAVAAIHAAPERGWTLSGLAADSAMSRTAFTDRFKALMGVAPMTYVTQWRMAKAAAWLREPGATVGAVARLAGYGSETAFSTAFRREFGVPPRDYARGGR